MANTHAKSLNHKYNGKSVISYVGNSLSTRIQNAYKPEKPLRHGQRRTDNRTNHHKNVTMHEIPYRFRSSFIWVPTGRTFMMNGNKWSHVCKPLSIKMKDIEFSNGLNDSFKKVHVWRPKALISPMDGDMFTLKWCMIFWTPVYFYSGLFLHLSLIEWNPMFILSIFLAYNLFVLHTFFFICSVPPPMYRYYLSWYNSCVFFLVICCFSWYVTSRFYLVPWLNACFL